MKKTEPAGGCLGFVFGLCVILYVVFGMLWMFIKEHIGLICIIAIIIGVLWYRNKLKNENLEEGTKFFEYVKKFPNNRFFVITPLNETTIYIDTWRTYGFNDDCEICLAYQAVKGKNGETYVRVYQVSCDRDMKLKSGQRGCVINKLFSLLFVKDFDIEEENTENLFVKIETDDNSIDYFYEDKSKVKIAEIPKNSEDYKRLYKLLEDNYDDPDYANYDNSFNYDTYEEIKKYVKNN